MEMCSEYSKLMYSKIKDPIFTSKEEKYITINNCHESFADSSNAYITEAHTALLGYIRKPNTRYWLCVGSLISKRFVLTAAHCEQFGSKDEPRIEIFARLGDPGFRDSSDYDFTGPTDYKIVQHIIHPNYKSPSLYHDIALFRLERDVDFNKYVRPICLNTDNMLRPPAITSTDSLRDIPSFKVLMNTISAEECDNSFLYMVNRNEKLAQGIVDNIMLCAVAAKPSYDSCGGNSGGAIKIKLNGYECMYSQIGVSAFSEYCKKNCTSIYTRVSNYVPWIERIVWPKL